MKKNNENQEQKGVTGWIDKRLPIFTFMNHNLKRLPNPKKSKLFLEFWLTCRYNPSNYDCYGDSSCYAIYC